MLALFFSHLFGGDMTHAHILIDLGFGDAGKGSMVDYFVRHSRSDLVVRFSGGAQAAHNVVTDHEHHTFRQFGSGTLYGARTLYTRDALLDPLMFLDEANALMSKGVREPTSLFLIEDECAITTIFQAAMNRVREVVRGDGRHGSCGLGIGETMSDKEETPGRVLRVADLGNRSLVFKKLEALQKQKLEEALILTVDADRSLINAEMDILSDVEYVRAATDAYLNIRSFMRVIEHGQALDILRGATMPIFEGSQGVLLDEDYGFYPYITRSSVTPKQARSLCDEAGVSYSVTGILRAYAVRHGAGPMPTEDKILSERVKDHHNTYGPWQRDVRVGHFDVVLARYAIDACGGIDDLVITCTDRLAEFDQVKVASAYVEEVQSLPLVPLALRSVGKQHKREHSEWLMRQVPLYQQFNHPDIKSSFAYQSAYAHHVHALIDRTVRLSGISRGMKAGDKYLF